MITFKYVRWKNFLSTGNNFTEIQLDRSPSTLIIGDNGAGKSTILDALCFGLFGKPFRPISKTQLLNSINQRDCVVEVEFMTQNKSVKVVRSIKPNKFEVYVDDVMINQDASARDYQKHLEQQVLKLNYKSFTQVVILGSSTFVPFMQLSAKARREVVEDILDIRIFSLMNMILKGRLKDLSSDINDNRYQLDLYKEKISLQQKYIKDLEGNKDTLIEQKKTNREKNKEEVVSRKSKINGLLGKNKDLLSKLIGEEECKDRKEKIKGFKVTLQDKKSGNQKMVDFYNSNDDCPTCHQPIEEDFKKSVLSEAEENVKKYSEGLINATDQLKKINEKLNSYSKVGKFINDNEVEIVKLNSSISQLEKFNESLTSEIEDIMSGDVTKEDHNKLNELSKVLKTLDGAKSLLKENMTYYDMAKNLLQDSGIKTKIVKQYLPIMNKLVNTYLSSMDFFVNFNLDENFNETIKSRFRDEFSYSNFSEGEKMRIDLALLFTWRAIAKMKNSTNTNLLILDEIFDSSLDGSGTDDFLNILKTFESENVFVISHKQDVLIEKFRSVLKFEKVKNFSHIAI